MERRIKEINRFTVRWTAYFAFADTFLPFDRLDKWLRRRLRQVRWKEWKRAPTVTGTSAARDPDSRRSLMGGIAEGLLAHRRVLAPQRALPNAYWHKTLGLKGFLDPYRGFREC